MDGLINYFSQHQDHFLFTLAGLCLLLELGILGMSGPLLFVALACLLTGILVSLHLLQGWEFELFSVGVLSVLSAALLWRPFKKFQNAQSSPDLSSDMIGRELPVTLPVTHSEGRVAYSGIEWQARLDASCQQPIALAARARVVKVDGSLLIVIPRQ